MNWEAFGAIAEMLGALGVVATLVYLASQIRQNTLAMRGQAIGNVTQTILQEVLPFTGHDIASIFTKAVTASESLTPEEHMQLDAWMVVSFTARQNEFAQYRLGTLDEAVWKSTHHAVRENLANSYGRSWWETLGKQRFMPEFVVFVESLDWKENSVASPIDLVEKRGT
jgi:hypothetical protein